ncbi:hypothetical protein [Paenibacillus sp. FSL H3-0333]|uniref:hypothetical protein n=1 Tax=Paenibacillus sp. FSL H3-0333 TaxID=2921373 RepID=UPI0030FC398C
MYYLDYLTLQERAVYEQARTTVEMMEELMSLRAENSGLTKKLDERDNYIDGLYKNSIGQMGNLLSGLIDKAER